MGKSSGVWCLFLGAVLAFSSPARGVDVGRWNGPDLGLGISRALVRYLLASPDAVEGPIWMYVLSGSRELDLGFVGFCSADTVCVAAQRYRPGGMSAPALVDLLQRQGFPPVAADGRRALLTGEDGSSGQPLFFLVMSPDPHALRRRGPLLVTLDEDPWRTLLDEGEGWGALERRLGRMLSWPLASEVERGGGAP